MFLIRENVFLENKSFLWVYAYVKTSLNKNLLSNQIQYKSVYKASTKIKCVAIQVVRFRIRQKHTPGGYDIVLCHN